MDDLVYPEPTDHHDYYHQKQQLSVHCRTKAFKTVSKRFHFRLYHLMSVVFFAICC